MSNARSPRDVCSTTIGIRGISSLLAAGCPHLLRSLRLFLVGCPKLVACLRLLGRDWCHLGGNAVERLLHAQVGADAISAAVLEELVDVLLDFPLPAQLVANLVVRHLQRELVRDRLEQQLARDRLLRL